MLTIVEPFNSAARPNMTLPVKTLLLALTTLPALIVSISTHFPMIAVRLR